MTALFLDGILMTLHFDGLNLMSHFISQPSSAFRSSCSCILSLMLRIFLYNKLASAKRRTSDSVWLGMSLLYVKNNKGPSTVTCGTPDNTSSLSDSVPSSTTCCFLFELKDLIHALMRPRMP